MDKELIPAEVAITVVISNPASTIENNSSSSPDLNIEANATEDKTSRIETTVCENITSDAKNDDSPLDQPSRTSSTKSRNKKSRKTDRTADQALADEVDKMKTPPKMRPKLALPIEEADRLSISPSSKSFDSIDSSASTSSSLKTGPDRKINRILSMIQSMQQTLFTQQQPQPAQPKQQENQEQDNFQRAIAHQQSTNDKHSAVGQRDSIIRQLQPDLNRISLNSDSSTNKRLFGLGRSQDSLMSTRNGGSMNKPNPLILKRNNSVNSWTGSQFSGYTSVMSEGVAPPLVHSMPHHRDGWTSFFIVGSSTYAQLLIVICIVAALSEVVTHNVPFFYFEVYFAYLYSISILFFLYVFGYLLQSKRKREEKKRLRKLSKSRRLSSLSNQYSEVGQHNSVSPNASISVENEASTTELSVGRFIVSNTDGQRRRFSRTDSDLKDDISKSMQAKGLEWTPSAVTFNLTNNIPSEIVSYSLMDDEGNEAVKQVKTKKLKVSDNDHSHGSFFLRVGAVAFGLGTMIYDGLEFGAFLEVPPDSPCFALLRGLNPLLNAVFVFLQMYFIFISARLNIHKFKAFARFGLMHCLATNVCIWIRTLVRESLKEINGHLVNYKKTHSQMKFSAPTATSSDTFLHHVAQAVAAAIGNNEGSSESSSLNDTVAGVIGTAAKSKKVMSLWELTGNVSCGRRFVLGDLIMDAAPFLYPFLIEYSLIGAAVIYVTWSHIGVNPKYYNKVEENQNSRDTSIWSQSRQLRIDCVGSSKGLFLGLIFFSGSLLCLVLFFVFTPQPQYHRLGLFLADVAHCVLLVVSLCAMALGAYRARHLHFHADHEEELGTILLRISSLGMFAYSVFSMIAGALTSSSTYEPPILVFINGLLTFVEVTVQTLFISDMSRRSVNTPEDNREKPGRQSVTFLLITNMTLWLVYTFEMQKVEANPVQLNFYGFLPWAIVQRLTIPLCIFYRFHSAIVYSEIWKNSYRYHAHQQ